MAVDQLTFAIDIYTLIFQNNVSIKSHSPDEGSADWFYFVLICNYLS